MGRLFRGIILTLAVTMLFSVTADAKTLLSMFKGEKTSKIVAQYISINADSYTQLFESSEKIPWEKFNRVYISCAAVSGQGALTEGNVNGEVSEWENRLNNIVAQCRVHNPKMEIILQSEVGDSPDGLRRYLMAAKDPSNFSHSVFRLLQIYDLDGLDLGWQNKFDINKYAYEYKALLDAMRSKFEKAGLTPRGKKYQLTCSVWPGSQSPDFVAMMYPDVQQINIMSFGPAPKYSLQYYSKAYRAAGFPYERMLAGVVCDTTYSDFASGGVDNPDSVTEKCAYIKEMNMAGVFSWHLDADYAELDKQKGYRMPSFRMANWTWSAMAQ